jgi:C1A family cysteine protease
MTRITKEQEEIVIGNMTTRLTLLKDEPDKRDFKLVESTFKPMQIPKKVDWTKQMSPVKDQGRLGSCVGFAAAAMKEWQEQREHNIEVKKGKKYRRKQDHYDLSESWIYWNCKKIDPWPGEEGTSIRCAMQVLHKIGVPCEKAYPYNDKFKGKPEIWAKLIAKWGLIDSYYRCKGIDDLRLALPYGPVVIGIACFKEIFFVNESGEIPYPSNPNQILGGHAICAVGYNDKKKLIKFKNSWSKAWGQNGYGYLPYRYINDFMWDSWIAKDLSVTKKILNEKAMNEL